MYFLPLELLFLSVEKNYRNSEKKIDYTTDLRKNNIILISKQFLFTLER